MVPWPNMPEPECPSPDTFLRFVDGRSDEADALRIEHHVDTCTMCRELMAQMAHDRFARSSTIENTVRLDGAAGSGLPFIAGDPRDYRIEGMLSRGGLGIVWRARDLRLDRVVALKQTLLSGPEAARRFRREIELTARLQHPSIVSVYEAGSWPSGEPFYAMRLVEGRTLHERI
ncbi:MAG TPA: hypothetical protein VMV01_04730, partial [Planctomycetota bacterium]|nr:hypothetical protein [Planctomycetota bacterium]